MCAPGTAQPTSAAARAASVRNGRAAQRATARARRPPPLCATPCAGRRRSSPSSMLLRRCGSRGPWSACLIAARCLRRSRLFRARPRRDPTAGTSFASQAAAATGRRFMSPAARVLWKVRASRTLVVDTQSDGSGAHDNEDPCPRTRGHIDMGHRPEVPVKGAHDDEQRRPGRLTCQICRSGLRRSARDPATERRRPPLPRICRTLRQSERARSGTSGPRKASSSHSVRSRSRQHGSAETYLYQRLRVPSTGLEPVAYRLGDSVRPSRVSRRVR